MPADVNEQGALFGIAVPPGVKLTERQRFALELVAERRPSSGVLGAALHERRGCSYCKPGRPCRFASGEGAEMGSRLRELGLVRFSRKADHWYLVVASDAPSPGEGTIPF